MRAHSVITACGLAITLLITLVGFVATAPSAHAAGTVWVARTSCGDSTYIASVEVQQWDGHPRSRFKRISLIPGPEADLEIFHTGAAVTTAANKVWSQLSSCLSRWGFTQDATEASSIY